MKKNLLFSLAIACFTTLYAQPVLLTEDFSTMVNGSELNGQNGWSNCSSTPCFGVVPVAAGLGDNCSGLGCVRMKVSNTAVTTTLPYACSSPNSLRFGGDWDSPGKLFSPAATTNFYVGLRVNFTNFASVITRGDFFRLYGGASNFNTAARIIAINTGGGQNRFGIQANANGGSIFTDPLSKPLFTGTTYYLVLKYEFNAGTNDDMIKLYINPTGSSEPAAADLQISSANGSGTADPVSVRGLAFYGTTTALTNQAGGNASCIRVATTWGDVIPVEMTGFTAKANNQTNVLSWTTATERNVSHFDVEKSTDGVTNWNKIGTNKAAGNSVAVNTYSFVDESPFTVSYYRLKTKDNDGSESTSPVVSVKQNVGKGTFKVFPQPVGDVATVQLESATDAKGTITVFDASGRLVLTQNAVYTEGSNNLNISTQSLTNGLYLIHLNNGTTTITERFVKR